MAATNGAALPSMIGTSGPSISMTALSTPSPESAASTCSAVEHSGPVGVAEHGGEFGGGDGADIGADFAVGLAVGAGAEENDAGVGFGRMHGQRHRSDRNARRCH